MKSRKKGNLNDPGNDEYYKKYVDSKRRILYSTPVERSERVMGNNKSKIFLNCDYLSSINFRTPYKQDYNNSGQIEKRQQTEKMRNEGFRCSRVKVYETEIDPKIKTALTNDCMILEKSKATSKYNIKESNETIEGKHVSNLEELVRDRFVRRTIHYNETNHKIEDQDNTRMMSKGEGNEKKKNSTVCEHPQLKNNRGISTTYSEKRTVQQTTPTNENRIVTQKSVYGETHYINDKNEIKKITNNGLNNNQAHDNKLKKSVGTLTLEIQPSYTRRTTKDTAR